MSIKTLCPLHDRGVGPCTCGRSEKKGLQWEDVDEDTFRAKVFGGWIVKHMDHVHVSLSEEMRPQTGYEWRTSMVFIPDPEYKWEL